MSEPTREQVEAWRQSALDFLADGEDAIERVVLRLCRSWLAQDTRIAELERNLTESREMHMALSREVETLSASLFQSATKRIELEQALRDVEWTDEDPRTFACIACHAEKWTPHFPDCIVGKALRAEPSE